MSEHIDIISFNNSTWLCIPHITKRNTCIHLLQNIHGDANYQTP